MNKQTSNILSISPVDGRYHHICEPISDYFSEFALIKYRVLVEIRYFISLSELPIPSLKNLSKKDLDKVSKISSDFSLDDAVTVKNIEKKINHDVKAVEYFIKEKFDRLDFGSYKEYIHFGLTSQDVNNTAIPLMLKDSINNILSTSFTEIVNLLHSKSNELRGISMIARTHGQPASPTTFGKEFEVFEERLKNQINSLTHIPNNGKFGGASGNLSAHYVSYPKIDWDKFSDKFLKSLGLTRSRPTTQIEHYDNMAAIFHNLLRINTILIDLCRDIWHYISINY